MDCHRAYYLALLEGFTEFLPVSAASHLVLLPALFGWTEPSPAFMAATRIGTLLAVVIYFLDTLRAMAIGGIRFLQGKAGNAEARLAGYLVLGSLPIALTAFAIGDGLGPLLSHPLAIAATTLVFAGALGLAQKLGSEHRSETDLDWKDALIIGLGQAIGLAPGVSRTGMTLTCGLLRGWIAGPRPGFPTCCPYPSPPGPA